MTIKKFQGKTESEATEKARAELGEKAVVMNVKEIKPTGFFKAFKSSVFEVTAALEEENPNAQKEAFKAAFKKADTINMVADEPIVIPAPAKREKQEEKEEKEEREEKEPKVRETETAALEEKLENLQNLLEKKLVPEKKPEQGKEQEPVLKEPLFKEQPSAGEGFTFLKMLYGILLDNDINEKYVNQVMDEIEKVMRNGSSVDFILSNVYQKMILKLDQPKPIELTKRRPKVVFFIGPTGVGKTTTIAKIASRFKVEQGRKVALLTADTYRMAAAEQLRTYANILDTPLTIIYSPEELNEAIERVADYDLVLVDTAGFSHRNKEQREDVKKLIDNVDEAYEKEVYLVLSATTKYRDLLEIADVYMEHFKFRMIFTKLDETSSYGNIFNMKMYTGADLSYATTGQNVPDDIEVFDTQKIVKSLLGGK